MFTEQFIADLAGAVADQVIARLSTQPGAGSNKRLLSTEEAASYLGLPSSSSLRQRKCAGQIPEYTYVKMGGSVLYDRQGLDRWISELQEAA
jgi:Helix-turn-helix domain